ncbi:MAG: MFS transporter [Actinobacteria bacterium]|nr:MFS transporter [Actinomycetota bacterium]
MGLMFSSWLARLPSARAALGLSTAQLGVVLLFGALGALVAVLVSGVIHARLGSRRLMVVAAVVISSGYLVIGTGPASGSVALLCVGVIVNGVGVALINLAMNVESARIERAFGRTVIPQFHAGFSAGAVLGSLGGAACSALDVPVEAQLTTVAALGLVWRLASVRAGVVLNADEVPAASGTSPAQVRSGARASLHAWTEPRTLLIGLVAMAASLSEGSANNWLSLSVVDSFDRPEAVGGVVLGVFIGSMTAVRVLGTRLIDRYGRVPVLRASGLVSLTGLVVFGLAPGLPLAIVGVVAWGLGAALSVPIAIAAASDEPLRAAGRVAVVSSFATIASLVAPPVLGVAAQSLGTRHALLLVSVALAAAVAVSARVAPLGAVAQVRAATERTPVDAR